MPAVPSIVLLGAVSCDSPLPTQNMYLEHPTYTLADLHSTSVAQTPSLLHPSFLLCGRPDNESEHAVQDVSIVRNGSHQNELSSHVLFPRPPRRDSVRALESRAGHVSFF
jgi:hypothetical protein